MIKIKVTAAEKRKLDELYQMMNNLSLSLSQRRVAKMMFDELYYEYLNR